MSEKTRAYLLAVLVVLLQRQWRISFHVVQVVYGAADRWRGCDVEGVSVALELEALVGQWGRHGEGSR